MTGLANQVSAPDRVPYFIDVNGNMALAPLTAYGRSLIASATSADAVAALGLSLEIPRLTVATLPASPVANQVVVVTDALSGASCLVAGGVANVTCQWTGLAWVVIGGTVGAGSGTVTSVAFSVPSQFSITGSPLTTAGTLALGWQNITANFGLYGPTSGAAAAPTFRAMVKLDMPATTGFTDVSNVWSGTQTGTFVGPHTGNTVGNITGRAGTALALDALPAPCTAGIVPLGILANGNCIPGAAYQPLASNLTLIGNMAAPANYQFPVFKNGVLNWVTITECLDTAGQGLGFVQSSLTVPCNTSSGGAVSGGVAGALAYFTSATAVAPSLITQSGTTIAMPTVTALTVGNVSGNRLDTTLPTWGGVRTRAVQDVSGNEVVDTTAAKASGKCLERAADNIRVQDSTVGCGGVPAADSVTVAMVQAPLKTKSITFVLGADNGAVLVDGDDQPTIWRNNIAAMTITEVWCESDAGTPIINLQRDDGSPQNILSSNLTCTTGGATGTIAGAEDNLAVGDKIDLTIVTAGATAKRITVSIKATLD